MNLRTKRIAQAYLKKKAGWWPSEHGINGDLPADILDKAMDDLIESYQASWFRPPTYGEFADALSFVTRGQFTIEPLVDSEIPFDFEHMDELSTRDNQGQIVWDQTKPDELINRIPPGRKDVSDELAIQMLDKASQ